MGCLHCCLCTQTTGCLAHRHDRCNRHWLNVYIVVCVHRQQTTGCLAHRHDRCNRHWLNVYIVVWQTSVGCLAHSSDRHWVDS